MQITAVNDNKRAQSVIISGATGPNAPSINGVFDPSLEIHEDRVRYYKRGDAGVCIEHFKLPDGTRRWQIKRASAKGTNSALIWTTWGLRALEACRFCQWCCADATRSWHVGARLHLLKDAECKVRYMFKPQLFFVPVIESLMVVRFCFRLLKRRPKPRLPKTPSSAARAPSSSSCSSSACTTASSQRRVTSPQTSWPPPPPPRALPT